MTLKPYARMGLRGGLAVEQTCESTWQWVRTLTAPVRLAGGGHRRRAGMKGIRWGCWAALVVCLGLLLAGAASASEPIQGELYQIQPGDTCQDIVRRVGGGLTLEAFHKLNPELVGPGPHLLEPETRVRVRSSTQVLPEAHITEVRPEVKAVLVGNAPVDARPGQALQANDQVWTGKDASSEVTFQDNSYLHLQENSILVVYGSSSSRAAVKTRQVRLEAGTVSGGLASLRGGLAAPIRLETPAAGVLVASPELHVEVDAQKNSLVSVHRGQAKVSARGKTVIVEAAHGTVTRLGKAPEPPRALPTAPEWEPRPEQFLRAASEAGGTLTLAWKPVPGAASYQVEWAPDSQFRRDLRALSVRETHTTLNAKLGRHFFRIAARDASGLIGRFSSLAPVVVVRLDLQDGQGQTLELEAGRAGAAARADVLVARGGLTVLEADGGQGLQLGLSPLGSADATPMTVQPGLTVKKPGIYVLSIQGGEGSKEGAERVVRLVISILPGD